MAGDLSVQAVSRKATSTVHAKEPEPFSSNELRLTPRQCAVAAVLLLAAFYGLPWAWSLAEPFEIKDDYRIPYKLGNDYWFFARYSRAAVSGGAVLLLGDSVVWGHYVGPNQALSSYLNKAAGRDGRFLNLGVDGIHPAALLGLIKYYGRPIRNMPVVLHCNFLWLSSPRHDLQTEKEFNFNHPRLVPQSYPWLPCYRASVSERVGNVVERYVPMLSWSRHVRIAYFGGRTLARWTIEHPYDNPLASLSKPLPSAAEPPSPVPVARPWTEKGLRPYDADWVGLDRSFQWRCFRATIKLLLQRGNRVFVVIGPFNEHMLSDRSRSKYLELKSSAATWLANSGVPYAAPEPLPSREYADASHPLARGYRRLAARLLQNEQFRQFLRETNITPAGSRPVSVNKTAAGK